MHRIQNCVAINNGMFKFMEYKMFPWICMYSEAFSSSSFPPVFCPKHALLFNSLPLLLFSIFVYFYFQIGQWCLLNSTFLFVYFFNFVCSILPFLFVYFFIFYSFGTLPFSLPLFAKFEFDVSPSLPPSFHFVSYQQLLSPFLSVFNMLMHSAR